MRYYKKRKCYIKYYIKDNYIKDNYTKDDYIKNTYTKNNYMNYVTIITITR